MGTRPTLGCRLAPDRQRQVEKSLPAQQLSGEELAQAKADVAWLFRDARRRLTSVVQAGGPPEIELSSVPGAQQLAELAMRRLVQASGEMHWHVAVQLDEHPFRREWTDFVAWALGQGVVIRVKASLHPIRTRTLYTLQALPIS